jgi:hypothetical protein
MRYEKTEYIGDISITHDYEGTPEEIAGLIGLMGEDARLVPKIDDEKIKNMSFKEKQELFQYAPLIYRYCGIGITDLLEMDKDSIEWLYIFIDITIKKEKEAQKKTVTFTSVISCGSSRKGQEG